jgi:hypothetical protein
MAFESGAVRTAASASARGGPIARDSHRLAVVALACAAIAVLTVLASVFAQNVLIARFFPHMSRLATQFSPAYLRRELGWLGQGSRRTVFLGDSIVWGFRLPPEAAAVSLLRSAGCACVNLAYKHGSPANYYALARLLQAHGVRPAAVVIEVNRADFSPDSSGYRTLGGSVAQLAGPLLDESDRQTLRSEPGGARARIDRALSSFSLLYAMRLDIHEAMYGDNDPDPPRLTPALIRRIFDLPALGGTNVSVRYLTKTLDTLRAAGTPVLAFLVPMNHGALDPYVDRGTYRNNSAYLRRLLERGGARVLDFDSAFPSGEFVDEAHLNASGQRRLAVLLGAALRKLDPGFPALTPAASPKG